MPSHLTRVLAALLAAVVLTMPCAAAPRFDDYEIRVIRPRFFTKSSRLELSAGLATIVNQTFIYSFLATGLIGWHFNETLAAEAQVGYAVTTDRADKHTLHDHFLINTVLLRPESIANARLVWTPSYGKFNLTASKIVYFDTHLTAGAGTTGIRYLYDHCDNADKPAPASKQYQTAVVGLGQRYFLDRSSSVRIGLDIQRMVVDTADASCFPVGPDTPHAQNTPDNMLLYVAWSHYL